MTDETLQVETIEGLNSPTQVVFLGANDLLVSEKNGRIVRVTDGSVVGPVLELAANYADERGVLGLTLHPQFAENRFVYIYWTWTGEGAVPEGLLGASSEDIELVLENGNRIDRFVWDGEQLTFDRNIIELPSKITDLTLDRRRGNHNGGVIAFGPDGKLYAVNGDHNVRGALTNVADGPSIEESGLVGVVIRLNDDGSVPEDNPFIGEGGDAAKIFAYGIRNSFGFDFHASGQFWMEVNGQASYDQISRLTAGANAGWIQLLGPPERFDDYKALEIDTDRKLDNPSFPPENLAASSEEALSRLVLLPGAEYQEPAFAWRKALAPAGFHFMEGTALGDEYEGDLLVGDVNTGTLWHFDVATDGMSLILEGPLADGVNDNGDDLVGEMTDNIFGEGFLVATDIETGPDGSLWVTSIAGSAIYHITKQ
jgi:glucose/arabinose dehydrogenase